MRKARDVLNTNFIIIHTSESLIGTRFREERIFTGMQRARASSQVELILSVI